MLWYQAGTAQVTSGSAAVVGTGTQWVAQAKPGEAFIGPDNLLYEIIAVPSNTALTLDRPYGGASATGVRYRILPTQGYLRSLQADVVDLIRLYAAVPDNVVLAQGAATEAAGSATTASTRATAAETARAAAVTARTGAETARTGAETAQSAAAGSATAAATSATNAGTKATEAATSATAAAKSKTDAETIANNLATQPVRSVAGKTGIVTLAKADVGLPNADNTSDAAKPVSTATQTALNLKADKGGTAFTGATSVAMANPRFSLTKGASGQDGVLFGYLNAFTRWGVALGDASPEAGNNAGSDFAIYRYADNGAFLGTALNIKRSTGTINTPNAFEAGGTIYSGVGFSCPGVGGWAMTTTSFSQEGSYKAVSALNISSLSDTMNIRGFHYPGVESFMRISVGGSGNYWQFNNNGNAYAIGGWLQTSDQRVKYDNQVITDALDKLEQLTGYTYLRQDMHSKDGVTPRRAGLIAQDILKVLPEALNIPANYDPVKDRGDLLSVEGYALLGLVVNAIKELRAQVRSLQPT